MIIRELTADELKKLDKKLSHYDAQHTKGTLYEMFSIGYVDEKDVVIGGLFATSTAYDIVYVSTLFVEEAFRGQGIGKKLMLELELQARDKGAKMIRLDTFDWQGKEFYQKLGYEEVGCYMSEEFNFSEHFFLKKL